MRARPRLSVFTIVYVALCRDAGWEPCPRPYAGWLPVSHKISQIAFITAHIGSDSFPNVHMRAIHLRLTVDVAVAVRRPEALTNDILTVRSDNRDRPIYERRRFPLVFKSLLQAASVRRRTADSGKLFRIRKRRQIGVICIFFCPQFGCVAAAVDLLHSGY